MHANLCSTTASTRFSSSDGLPLDGKSWTVFVLTNFFINHIRVDKGNGFFRMAFIFLYALIVAAAFSLLL